ncbi:MAG: hypothetical protein KatS3mg115_1459 [Candidatus Poribacteria bacterium]|nr:MAG: hypothetical protein KatS3mg115_1459 [Candidatus Poribacteria bacterium]
MKRVIVWIGVGLWLLAVGESRAVNFLERELEFGGKGAGEGGFSDQIVLGFDAQGNILVSDAKNRLVQKLDPNGRFLWQYPAAGAESSVLMQPGDIAADPAGNVYVADTTITPVPRNEDETPLYLYTPCVHKFSPSGEFLTTIPIDSLEALPSAPATPVRELITPEGTYALGIQPSGYDRAVQIALDPQGNLFVLDAERPGRQRILKYSPEGERLAVFGRYGSGDGAFDTPEDFTVAPNGHVYIADTGNHRIVEFDNDGAFVRAFASQGYGKNELTKPSFIVATREGELWVSDETKAVRRQLGPLGPIALGAGAAPQWSVVGDEGLRILPRGSALDPLSETEALALRLYRLEELFLLDEEEEEQEALTDEALKQAFRIRNTLYHKTIHRIARFDTEGNYRGEISYRVDQLDERRHDLRFLAADPLGHVYLLDASELTVLKHRVVGFTLRPSEVDAISSSRFSSQTNNYLEDYEDIDQLPDIDSEETLTRAHSRAIFNWDLTRNWSAYLEEAYVFSGRDGDQEYPRSGREQLRV